MRLQPVQRRYHDVARFKDALDIEKSDRWESGINRNCEEEKRPQSRYMAKLQPTCGADHVQYPSLSTIQSFGSDF